MVALNALDFVFRAEHQTDALVKRCWGHIQNRLLPGAGASTRLLHHHANRIGFIEQTQATGFARVFIVARVHEHTTAHENAVRFSHHGGDPAHVEIFATRPGFTRQTFVDIACDGRFPESAVRGVDRKLLRVHRYLQFRVGQHELTQIWIQGESGGAIAHRQHQHGGRSVQGITGGYL